MRKAMFEQPHVRIGGILSAAVAAVLIVSFTTLGPGGLSADGASFITAGTAVTPSADVENALIRTRVQLLDLSKLSAASYGD